MASSLCCANPPSLNPTCGGGSVVDNFGGIKSYIVGSTGSKQAVILISDVYGNNLSLKIADKVAESGYFVVVPGFIHGDPFEAEDKGFEEAKPVIAALKEKGINSVGAAGYCWGAKVAIELANAGEIQAAVLSHPSFVSVGDIREVKCPIAILGAETDHLSPPELVKQFEETLASKSDVEYFVKIFPGVAHGWAVRYKVDDESAIKNAEEARLDLVHWFTTHLN
ncbi:hypothetical protein LUZ60_003951 [Juncus effusus]|nr:hypothetical protein LUZ60_003951 [Juncus effusus]